MVLADLDAEAAKRRLENESWMYGDPAESDGAVGTSWGTNGFRIEEREANVPEQLVDVVSNHAAWRCPHCDRDYIEDFRDPDESLLVMCDCGGSTWQYSLLIPRANQSTADN